MVLVKKAQARLWKNFFSNFQILLENPTHWGLETSVNPIFAKPALDIFAVCSLASRMNLLHIQQNCLCKSKLLTGEG